METGKLIVEAAHAAHLSYEQLARHVGSSRRSVQRWVNGESYPLPWHWHRLAPVVHRYDPELAARVARAGGTTLEALGIVKPPPPPPAAPLPAAAAVAPPPPPPLTIDHLDALVCAAAEALDARPREVRAAVASVFARAARLGYRTEAVARAFEEERARAAAPPGAAKAAEAAEADSVDGAAMKVAAE
ncbi:MAG: helix-turn-helix domain-containing protein [Myxococcales bacterium]